MSKLQTFFPAAFVLVMVMILGAWSWMSPGTIVPLQQVTATPLPASTPMSTEDSWVIVDLPPDASQLEYGTEVYRLVCKACHGDKGQGLTDDWRAQWAPKDQNCWQSKCHALNHPPDGFYMPMSPPVVGPPLQMFETAQDLYDYIHKYMPWHDRGSMTEKESWSVTAYILKINNVDPGTLLNSETASQIRLRASKNADSSPTASSPDLQPTQAVERETRNEVSSIWIVALVAVGGLVLFGVFALIGGKHR